MALISVPLGVSTGSLTEPAPPTETETAPTPGEVEYDETVVYHRLAAFDHAGRPFAMIAVDPEALASVDPAPLVGGLLEYNRRGLPHRAAAFLDCFPGDVSSIAAAASSCSGGTVQIIVDGIEYLRDGLVETITYGDGVGRDPTVSTTTYDIRRRPIRFRTDREATGSAPESLAAVTRPVDQRLVWDAANNLVAQIDDRDAGEWPAGHRPQSVNIRHDALYRVVGAELDYTQTSGARTPVDSATDWRQASTTLTTSGFRATYDHDPMRQEPAPMVPDDTGIGRVASLTWTWDYLANTTEWTDDASSFYERSIGGITNGDDESATLRPSALYLSTNIGGSGYEPNGGSGWLEVDYGAGGNVVAMTVHGQCDHAGTEPEEQCEDTESSIGARRAALRERCVCAVEQHYVYRWDELNRLAEARRYDREGTAWALKVRQRYRYDGANVRTVKQTLDQDTSSCGGASEPACERVALSVYPGDFERRGLVRGFDGYEADDSLGTETQYNVAGARTVWRSGSALSGYDREHRLTVGLTDLIQTTAAVLDVRTGELLEASTYYPNGARETYLVDSSTATAPEVAGFTGKEGDEEVGVVYFGERYLIPRIGRWASPDPLHVHAAGGGEALNSFHYVGGNLLAVRDPLGLDPLTQGGAAPSTPPPTNAPPPTGGSPTSSGAFPRGTYGSGGGGAAGGGRCDSRRRRRGGHRRCDHRRCRRRCARHLWDFEFRRNPGRSQGDGAF
ncbi:MAG: hypothetical protein M5U28_15825 [Sandaracinaceae bacterium]|nr:hypothetical protein [Sandaracinaceae bacterium]